MPDLGDIEEKASDAGLEKADDAAKDKAPDKADNMIDKGEKAADAKIGQ